MKILGTFLLVILLAGCSAFESKVNPPLKGDRKTILENPDAAPLAAAAPPQIGDAASVSQWTQSNGNAFQTGVHANFTPQFVRVWQTTIGDANSNRGRITARPLAADGKIFAMDASGMLSALDAKTGKIFWRVATRGKKLAALSGGMAIENDKIFVTNGLNEVQAISIQNGGQLWKMTIDAPARAAPVAWGGRVFVVSRGGQAYGLDAATGKIIWQSRGLLELAGVLSGASPAVDEDVVLIPYTSGELVALSPGNGATLWNESVTGNQKNDNLSSLRDMRAPPMITRDTIIAANYASVVMGIERRLGDRMWSRQNGGALQPMTLSGDTVFLITVNQQLSALSRDTGNVFWSVSLLPKDKDEAQKSYWYGPLLLNGQLFVLSADGRGQLHDAATGKLLRATQDFPEPAENPIVYENMVYWVTASGDVVAYR